MLSPSARITLPEIPLSQSARSSPTHKASAPERASQKHIRSTRPKPSLIARKIADDELFGDTLKLTNLGLSQIAEEKAMETEEFEGFMGGSQVELDEGKEVHKVKNMFQKDSLVSSKYKEVGKGPSYDDDGAMVKHSIVGSVDMYERYHRNMKKHLIKESTGSSFDKDNLSASEKSFSMRLLNVAGSGSFKLDQTPTSHARLNTQNSMIVGKKAVSSENKKVKKDLRVSKQDLLKKIDRFRELQAQFYEDEKHKHDGLTHGDLLHHTKEERCLQEYDKVVNNWKDTIEKITNKIHRTNGKSVMLRADDFREKIEQAEAFNIVQTDQERFGTMFWYMNLRNEKQKNGKKERAQQRVIHDIPYGFSCPQLVRPVSSLEVIRKPSKLNQTNVVLPPISDVRYLDRTKDEYLHERSTMLESELSKVMSSHIGDTNELIVEGQNKLELEVEAFFNVNKGKEVFVAPKNFFEEKSISLEEEYIVVNYDGKEIIKNGLSAFVK